MAAPTIPYTIPGTVDQDRQTMECRISFDPATAIYPDWVDCSDRLRSFTIDRGGENELDLIDAGTATVVLDNQDRELDPFNTSSSFSPNVKPMRRLWLRSMWDGEAVDQFYGWTGSFKPLWEGMDAIVEVTGTDGYSVLSRDAVSVTTPPRDTYKDVMDFDRPYIYMPLDDPVGTVVPANVGRLSDGADLVLSTAGTYGAGGGVVGLPDTAVQDGVIRWGATAVGDFQGRNKLAIEFLFYLDTAVGTNDILVGPQAGGVVQYKLQLVPTTNWVWQLRIGGANVTLSSAEEPKLDTWEHWMFTYDGANQRIYRNGVQETTVGRAGVLNNVSPTDTLFVAPGAAGTARMAHFALYDYVPSAARILAHYEAARLRGRPREDADDRVRSLLAGTGLNSFPQRLQDGQRTIEQVYFRGQDPKGEMEQAVLAEGDPAMFFFGKDGAAVFLDRDHRTRSPWNTVQATFDDDGTDIAYEVLEIDDGEAFIYNDVRVTPAVGNMQQSFDPTSIAAYQRRVLDRGSTLNISEADADAESDALLAKYKDPQARVTRLSLDGVDVAQRVQMLNREIGDQVRVIRRPPGGGSAIDQSCFIRKMTLSGDADNPYWKAEWAVAKR